MTFTRQLRDLCPDAELSKVDISCIFRKIPMMGRWIKVTDVGRPLDGRKTVVYICEVAENIPNWPSNTLFLSFELIMCAIFRSVLLFRLISFTIIMEKQRVMLLVITHPNPQNMWNPPARHGLQIRNVLLNYYFNKTMIFLLIFTTRLKLQCLKDGRFITIENDVSKVNLSNLQ